MDRPQDLYLKVNTAKKINKKRVLLWDENRDCLTLKFEYNIVKLVIKMYICSTKMDTLYGGTKSVI